MTAILVAAQDPVPRQMRRTMLQKWWCQRMSPGKSVKSVVTRLKASTLVDCVVSPVKVNIILNQFAMYSLIWNINLIFLWFFFQHSSAVPCKVIATSPSCAFMANLVWFARKTDALASTVVSKSVFLLAWRKVCNALNQFVIIHFYNNCFISFLFRLASHRWWTQ